MNGFQRLALVVALASAGSLATLGWAMTESNEAEREFERVIALPVPGVGIPGSVGNTMRQTHSELVMHATREAVRKTDFYVSMQKWVLWAHLALAVALVAAWVMMGFRRPTAT